MVKYANAAHNVAVQVVEGLDKAVDHNNNQKSAHRERFFILDNISGYDFEYSVHYLHMLEKSTKREDLGVEAWQNFHDDAVEKLGTEPALTPVEVPVVPTLKPEKVVDERPQDDAAKIEQLRKYLSPTAETHEDSVGDLDFQALSEAQNILREDIQKKYGVDVSALRPSLLARAWLGVRKLSNEEMSNAINEYNKARELKEIAEQRRRTLESALKSGVPKKGPKPPPQATM